MLITALIDFKREACISGGSGLKPCTSAGFWGQTHQKYNTGFCFWGVPILKNVLLGGLGSYGIYFRGTRVLKHQLPEGLSPEVIHFLKIKMEIEIFLVVEELLTLVRPGPLSPART